MTLITEALNRAARQCSVKAPSSWVTATRDDHVSIRDDFLHETVDDILERVDLPSPVGAQTTITGTGVENYVFPANFKRLHRDDLAVYDNFRDQPCVPITSDGEWTYTKDIGVAGSTIYFRLAGYEGNWSIDFYDAPTASEEITVSYSTVNWMADNAGTAGDAFTSNEDVLLLPRRIVECGIVWRFRERRGLDYQGKFREYETLMAQMINDRRVRRVISTTGGNNGVRWQDLIPSFIPDS